MSPRISMIRVMSDRPSSSIFSLPSLSAFFLSFFSSFSSSRIFPSCILLLFFIFSFSLPLSFASPSSSSSNSGLHYYSSNEIQKIYQEKQLINNNNNNQNNNNNNIKFDESHLFTKIDEQPLQQLEGINTVDIGATKPPPPVQMINNKLYVNNQLFFIKGICYSPVPVGESVYWPPSGDYFTPDYAYIWQRDLPLIKAMGANTIRIYGWKNDADHTLFLDTVHSIGLYVLVTFYLGNSQDNPVFTQDQRNKIIGDFAQQVARYAEHPAILMWSFGNELNGWWNGFMQQFSAAYNCWWTPYCSGYYDTNSDCQWQSTCVYYQMYSWINAAAKAARIVTTRPIISGIADVDYVVGTNHLLDKIARFDYLLPDIAAWAVQLYRGRSFGGYFEMYRWESGKPIIVTEYGVDAYNDPCGWPENNYGQGCFNLAGEEQGGDVAVWGRPFIGCREWWLDCSKPGVEAQTNWDMGLSSELMNQGADRGGIVLGGFLMAWTDEFWKGSITQDFCWSPCRTWDIGWCRTAGAANFKPGGSAGCSWKAHFTCGNWDTQFHDLCGYWLAAAPDNYVNEEWFGITTPGPCGHHDINGGHRLDTLYVRPAFLGMQQLWTGVQEVDTSFATCDALLPCWQCSTKHKMEDLNDGICADVCAVKPTTTGPGSSRIHARQSHSGPSSHDFFSLFGTPLLIGAIVILCAVIVSACILLKKRNHEEGSGEREVPILLNYQSGGNQNNGGLSLAPPSTTGIPLTR